MSSQPEQFLFDTSLADLFNGLLAEARTETQFEISDYSHAYLISIMESYAFSEKFFEKPQESMVSESLFKALQMEEEHAKKNLLKSLGESLLFRVGFFGESYKKKLTNLSYYIGVGTTAFSSLYMVTKDPAHKDIESRFSNYVDLFNVVGGKLNLTSQNDLIYLLDRATDAKSAQAEKKLACEGLTASDLKKASNQ